MSHAPFFSAEDPVALASWLLEEISRGHLPVWPSTPRYAARIVEGMARLHRTRRDEVMTALPTAPRASALDWDGLLDPIRRLDARRCADQSPASSPSAFPPSAFSTAARVSLSS